VSADVSVAYGDYPLGDYCSCGTTSSDSALITAPCGRSVLVMTMNETHSIIDRGVIVDACIALCLGIVQYIILKLVLDDNALFWKTLVVTIAAIAATQIWIDATAERFKSSQTMWRVMAPALSVVVFGLVVALSAVSPQRGDYEDASYAWSLAACGLAAVHRQLLTRSVGTDE
jgi:hypothetical protein